MTIQFHSNSEDISVKLFEQLTKPLVLNKDPSKRVGALMLFQGLTQSVIDLGWYEHTSDWDLHLSIKLNTNEIIESQTGYEQFIFLDTEKEPYEGDRGFINHSESLDFPRYIRITKGIDEHEGPIYQDILIREIKTININE